jgi:hypothetical protein
MLFWAAVAGVGITLRGFSHRNNFAARCCWKEPGYRAAGAAGTNCGTAVDRPQASKEGTSQPYRQHTPFDDQSSALAGSWLELPSSHAGRRRQSKRPYQGAMLVPMAGSTSPVADILDESSRSSSRPNKRFGRGPTASSSGSSPLS